MSISDYLNQKFLEAKTLDEIIPFREKIDLEEDCCRFQGNPRKHPYDSNKLILIPDPENHQKLFLEFLLSDIAHIEELPRMSSKDGVSLTQVSIWVKKGSWGVKTEGFQV